MSRQKQQVPAVDLLFDAVAEKGHVCVGLDTSISYIPPDELKKTANDAEAVLAFNRAVIDATSDIAACYKVQIAYYEQMGVKGLKAYAQTLEYIRGKKCIVIADIKRGDIAETAGCYAQAHFTGEFEADFVTLNPYLGMDSLAPWLSAAKHYYKGAFVLMRTSNPGMKDFEYLETGDGKRLYHKVGEKIAEFTEKNKGSCGYGIFGVVVGCTESDEAAGIRKKYPGLFFLIPGYGAQGGGAKDAVLLLKDGNGGVVNASRSIITAWQKNNNGKADNAFAAEAAREAVIIMRDEIKREVN